MSDSEFNENFKSDFNVKENNYIKIIPNSGLSAKEKKELYENEMKYKHLGVKDLKVKNSNVKIGKVQLLNFYNWKKTQPLVNKLENAFKTYNKNTSDYLKVASKIGTYNQNKQGTKPAKFTDLETTYKSGNAVNDKDNQVSFATSSWSYADGVTIFYFGGEPLGAAYANYLALEKGGHTITGYTSDSKGRYYSAMNTKHKNDLKATKYTYHVDAYYKGFAISFDGKKNK